MLASKCVSLFGFGKIVDTLFAHLLVPNSMAAPHRVPVREFRCSVLFRATLFYWNSVKFIYGIALNPLLIVCLLLKLLSLIKR